MSHAKTPKLRLDPPHLRAMLNKVRRLGCGCWVWTGCLDKDGYGKVKVWGVNYAAHRLFYVVFKRSIPAGYDIDHRCNRRDCCNPEHLRAIPLEKNRARIHR